MLAHLGIGSSHDRHFGNPPEGHQNFLHLCSADVLSPANDDVGDPIGDRHVAVRVHDRYVAGVVPAIVVECLRRQRRVGVTEEALRAPREDLPGLTESDLVAVGVDENDLATRQGSTVGGESFLERVHVRATGNGGVLGRAVHRVDRET